MERYILKNTEDIVTPALVYYKELMIENTDKIISMAGGAERLWPHVKSHKSIDMVKFQINKGIRRFKSATVAEAEMVCRAGADCVILSMPPAGNVPKRVLSLAKAFPDTKVYAIVDNDSHIEMYSKTAKELNTVANLVADINMGMDRTGVPTRDAGDFYRRASKAENINMCGFHCYDGNRHESNVSERQSLVDNSNKEIFELQKELKNEGYNVDFIIFGGSPSFPCHVKYKSNDIYYSPGTAFLNDMNYSSAFADMDMIPAVTVLGKVISHPEKGLFTLDIGSKAIACDSLMEKRGKLVNIPNCKPIKQNEEHWVFKMDEGYENNLPEIGSDAYVIPAHVCPCAMLYPEILIAENGEIKEAWEVTARNRKITY